jgi:hypothetical protein
MNYKRWELLMLFCFVIPTLVLTYLHRNHIRHISYLEKRILKNSVSCAFKVDDDEPNILKTQTDPNIILPSNSLEYSVKPAAFHELGAVAKLRIHVFYPQVS